jgi:uncharacterized repeat protein (TIGR02543 family)
MIGECFMKNSQSARTETGKSHTPPCGNHGKLRALAAFFGCAAMLLAACDGGSRDPAAASPKKPVDEPAVLLSAKILKQSPDRLTLAFDAAVDVEDEDVSGFTLNGPRALVATGLYSGSGTKTIVLQLDGKASIDEGITLSYNFSGDGKLTSKDNGKRVESFQEFPVTNSAPDTLPPHLTHAIISDAAPGKLVLVFSENLKKISPAPSGSDLGFDMGSDPGTLALAGTACVMQNATITLDLESDAQPSQHVWLNYSASTGKITDTTGNPLVDITTFHVTSQISAWNMVSFDWGEGIWDGTGDAAPPLEPVHPTITSSIMLPKAEDYHRVKAGYMHTGWNDGASTTELADGDTPYKPNGDVTLTAVWTLVEYQIHYYLITAVNNSANPANHDYNPPSYTIESQEITLESPPDDGSLVFLGWYSESSLADNKLAVSIPARSTGAKYFYAKWEGAEAGWGGVWESWADDIPTVPDASDPVDLTGYTPPPAANQKTLTYEDNSGLVTLTFDSDSLCTISGASAGNNGQFNIASTGITAASTFAGRILVNGDNASIRPASVTITLNGVNINTVSPIALQSGANVTLVLAAEKVNTLTATSGAGLSVPVNNTITIIGSGTLTATGTAYHAGIGGPNGYTAGTIRIGDNAKVTASCINRAAGIGGGSGGGGGTIRIGGSAQVTATSSDRGAGIGGGPSGGGGTIFIGGSARVTAKSSDRGAGIGGGWQAGGGTITIGGNARVTATGAVGGAGIGSGNIPSTGSYNITIQDHAMVRASDGGGGGAGIGSGFSSTSATPAITIKGGPLVYAVGTGAGPGIGTGSYGTGTLNLTIQPEGNYTPVVIAQGGSGAAGIGAGSGAAFNGFITISGGFVLARSDGATAAADIGRGNAGTGTGTVIISGGSVYAANTSIIPAPKNAANGAPVYPLYVTASLGDNKTVSVPDIPDYAVKTIGKSVACFLSIGIFTAIDGLFPTVLVTAENRVNLFPLVLSAALWLPESNYSGITAVPGSGTYTANVTAEIVPYGQDLTTNRLIE